MSFRNIFIKDIGSERDLEAFLVAAISSILAIRFYLHITGYPQIGGDGLHIAHMLWGGLFMLVAIFLLLSFLTKAVNRTAAILGGIGFGTFIDELGKFITHDNNYFFKPTVSLIYVIFILLYLFIQFLERNRKVTKEEYLVNILESIKEAIVKNLDKDEEQKAFAYLKKITSPDILTKALANLLSKVEVMPSKKNIWAKINSRIQNLYQWFVKKSWFRKAITAFFIIESGLAIIRSLLLTEAFTDFIFGLQTKYGLQLLPSNFKPGFADLSFSEMGDLIFSSLSGVLVLVGVFRIFKSRIGAYKLFKFAVLISIFLTQFFIFYDIQFEALYGFIFNILLLIILDDMIEREERLQKGFKRLVT